MSIRTVDRDSFARFRNGLLEREIIFGSTRNRFKKLRNSENFVHVFGKMAGVSRNLWYVAKIPNFRWRLGSPGN